MDSFIFIFVIRPFCSSLCSAFLPAANVVQGLISEIRVLLCCSAYAEPGEVLPVPGVKRATWLVSSK